MRSPRTGRARRDDCGSNAPRSQIGSVADRDVADAHAAAIPPTTAVDAAKTRIAAAEPAIAAVVASAAAIVTATPAVVPPVMAAATAMTAMAAVLGDFVAAVLAVDLVEEIFAGVFRRLGFRAEGRGRDGSRAGHRTETKEQSSSRRVRLGRFSWASERPGQSEQRHRSSPFELPLARFRRLPRSSPQFSAHAACISPFADATEAVTFAAGLQTASYAVTANRSTFVRSHRRLS